MNLKQRFQRYFIGVMIGLLLVFVFFGERSCNDWMPNQRVLLRLSETDLIVTKNARCQLDCYSLDNDDILYALENGKVNFKKSDPQAYPLIYVVESEIEEKDFEVTLTFEARDSTSTLVEVWDGMETACACD